MVALKSFASMDVRLHGASPWHLKRIVVLFVVAANVSYHGARPWLLS
jgi:hypothetical protein